MSKHFHEINKAQERKKEELVKENQFRNKRQKYRRCTMRKIFKIFYYISKWLHLKTSRYFRLWRGQCYVCVCMNLQRFGTKVTRKTFSYIHIRCEPILKIELFETKRTNKKAPLINSYWKNIYTLHECVFLSVLSLVNEHNVKMAKIGKNTLHCWK